MFFLPLQTKRGLFEVTDQFYIMFGILLLIEVVFIPVGYLLVIIIGITLMICRIMDTAEPRVNYLKTLYRATAPRLTANYSDSVNPLYFRSKFMDEFEKPEEEYHG
ncbi:hypothetical protein [Bdellovibrio sp. BCCA]|uniref:hypothetical protein n=1 Tax=Bdellovibrio sp. BCCA TaxID=3136281 RepID=UPI0030F06FA8